MFKVTVKIGVLLILQSPVEKKQLTVLFLTDNVSTFQNVQNLFYCRSTYFLNLHII